MMPPVRDEHDNRGNYLSQTQQNMHQHHTDQMQQSGSPPSCNAGLSKAELRKVTNQKKKNVFTLQIIEIINKNEWNETS